MTLKDRHERWSITHGFYADMGGFRITSNHEEQGVSAEQGIPVNAKHFLYLLEYEYIDLPCLTEKDIKVTSSSDFFSKYV